MELETQKVIREGAEAANLMEPGPARDLIARLTHALEAVYADSITGQFEHSRWQERAEELEAIVNDGGNQAAKYWTRLTAAERERDRYRAALDRVREAARFGSGMDVNPTRMAGPTVEGSERWWQSWHLRADAAWRRNITGALDDKEAEK